MRWASLVISVSLWVAGSHPAAAARAIGPPIEELLAKPDIVRVARATAEEAGEDGKVLFSVVGDIAGESPPRLLLRTDEATAAGVHPGRTYIVGWTDVRVIALLREGYEKDPDGPSIAQVRGLPEPALYEDTPELRLLFESRMHAEPPDPRPQLDALLTQARREEPGSRNLVVTQLLLSPGLAAEMNAAQADHLRELLRAPSLTDEHRDYLLQVALRLRPELIQPWLAEEFRRNIVMHGTQYDLTSHVPGLMRTSAGGLGQLGDGSDIALLEVLLYANNPGVSKAALAAMEKLDASRTRPLAEKALQRGWVHEQTRRALEQFLKRNPGPT